MKLIHRGEDSVDIYAMQVSNGTQLVFSGVNDCDDFASSCFMPGVALIDIIAPRKDPFVPIVLEEKISFDYEGFAIANKGVVTSCDGHLEWIPGARLMECMGGARIQ